VYLIRNPSACDTSDDHKLRGWHILRRSLTSRRLRFQREVAVCLSALGPGSGIVLMPFGLSGTGQPMIAEATSIARSLSQLLRAPAPEMFVSL
jgi:hypothetical protein